MCDGNCLNADRIWACTPQIADDTEDAEGRGKWGGRGVQRLKQDLQDYRIYRIREIS